MLILNLYLSENAFQQSMYGCCKYYTNGMPEKPLGTAVLLKLTCKDLNMQKVIVIFWRIIFGKRVISTVLVLDDDYKTRVYNKLKKTSQNGHDDK